MTDSMNKRQRERQNPTEQIRSVNIHTQKHMLHTHMYDIGCLWGPECTGPTHPSLDPNNTLVSVQLHSHPPSVHTMSTDTTLSSVSPRRAGSWVFGREYGCWSRLRSKRVASGPQFTAELTRSIFLSAHRRILRLVVSSSLLALQGCCSNVQRLLLHQSMWAAFAVGGRFRPLGRAAQLIVEGVRPGFIVRVTHAVVASVGQRDF